MKVKVTQPCLTLCNPMVCIVHGILQARILEWVAFPFSRGSSQPRDRTQVSGIVGGFVTSLATRRPYAKFLSLFYLNYQILFTSQEKKSLSHVQLFVCPWICGPPGSSVHGIFQARILEWVAISLSRGSAHPRIKPRCPAFQEDSLPSGPPGNPKKLVLKSSTFA